MYIKTYQSIDIFFLSKMSTTSHVKKPNVVRLFDDIHKVINTPEEIRKGHTKDKNYELNLQNNKIGLFTVDPYNFALTVVKLGNDLYRRSDLNKDEYLKISYKLINILLNMSQITTSYTLDVNTIDNANGYGSLNKDNRVKKMLENIDLSKYYVRGNYDEFGKVILERNGYVKTYYDYFKPGKRGDYILNVSVGLNMAAIIFMYFHHHKRTLKILETEYNFSIYNTGPGNCIYYGESVTCYANNKELFKKFGIVGDTFNIHDNFHRICLMFNLYFYCFKQEFIFDELDTVLPYNRRLITYDPAYREAYYRIEHIFIGEDINYKIDLNELYNNNQKYIISKPIKDNYDAKTKFNDSKQFSKQRTSKHVLVKRKDPVQAVPLVTLSHVFMAYIDGNKVIISDNNDTYTDDLVFEKTEDGLIKALLALQKYLNHYYGYKLSLFNRLPKHESYINNLYYTFSSMEDKHILLDDFDNFGITTFNLICLFYSKHFYVTYYNCFVSKQDICLIMFEKSTKLYRVSDSTFIHNFEEDSQVKEVIQIIDNIKARENVMKQRQDALSKDAIEFIKKLCDTIGINILSDKDLSEICNLEMSSYIIDQLGLKSIYISNEFLEYGRTSSSKLQKAAILNNCIAITRFNDRSKQLIQKEMDDNTTFKNILFEICKNIPTTWSSEHKYIFSVNDTNLDTNIKYMISQLQYRIIDGHNTVTVNYNMDKIYLLFAIAYIKDLPCKCIKGDNTQFIIDFSKVCEDIAEHVFGHNCYVYTSDESKRVRANSIIAMYGGNFNNYLSWLIILIIVIIVIILIRKSDIIKLLVN